MSASSSSKECSAITFAARATSEPLKSPDGDRPWPPLLSFYALTDSTHIRQEHLYPESIWLDPESRREPLGTLALSARFTGGYLARRSQLARLGVTRRVTRRLVRHLANRTIPDDTRSYRSALKRRRTSNKATISELRTTAGAGLSPIRFSAPGSGLTRSGPGCASGAQTLSRNPHPDLSHNTEFDS